MRSCLCSWPCTVVPRIGFTGLAPIADTPWCDKKWKQLRNGSECIQLFAEVVPGLTRVHALVARADSTTQAMCLSLSIGQMFDPLLIQVSALHSLLVPEQSLTVSRFLVLSVFSSQATSDFGVHVRARLQTSRCSVT